MQEVNNLSQVEVPEDNSHAVRPRHEPKPPFDKNVKSQFKPLLIIFVILFSVALFSLILYMFLNRTQTPQISSSQETPKTDSVTETPQQLVQKSIDVPILLKSASDSATPNPSPTFAPLPEALANKKLPEGYGAGVYHLNVPPGIPTQLTFSMSGEKDFGEKSSITVINPQGEIVDIPIFDSSIPEELEKEIAREMSGQSFIDKISDSVYIIKFLPRDPALVPFEGVWRVMLISVAPNRVTTGAVQL